MACNVKQCGLPLETGYKTCVGHRTCQQFDGQIAKKKRNGEPFDDIVQARTENNQRMAQLRKEMFPTKQERKEAVLKQEAKTVEAKTTTTTASETETKSTSVEQTASVSSSVSVSEETRVKITDKTEKSKSEKDSSTVILRSSVETVDPQGNKVPFYSILCCLNFKGYRIVIA